MSIAKIDVDVLMDAKLLDQYVYTRLRIIESLGYTPLGHQVVKTEKGYHLWFKIMETLSDDDLCSLQFLLGDDHKRCRFNYLRKDAGAFKTFNALFSKKLKHKERAVHDCDERCVQLGYCPYYVKVPDWCGRNPEEGGE